MGFMFVYILAAKGKCSAAVCCAPNLQTWKSAECFVCVPFGVLWKKMKRRHTGRKVCDMLLVDSEIEFKYLVKKMKKKKINNQSLDTAESVFVEGSEEMLIDESVLADQHMAGCLDHACCKIFVVFLCCQNLWPQ